MSYNDISGNDTAPHPPPPPFGPPVTQPAPPPGDDEADDWFEPVTYDQTDYQDLDAYLAHEAARQRRAPPGRARLPGGAGPPGPRRGRGRGPVGGRLYPPVGSRRAGQAGGAPADSRRRWRRPRSRAASSGRGSLRLRGRRLLRGAR